MSNLAWLIILIIALTLVGSLVLGLTAKHYYWGSRKGPPPKKIKILKFVELISRMSL